MKIALIRTTWVLSLVAFGCGGSGTTPPTVGGSDLAGLPRTVSQTIVENAEPFAGSFNIQNTGDCPMTWTASIVAVSGGNWLAATPLPTVAAPGTIAAGGTQAISYTISVKPPALATPLPPGLYQARIELAATCTTTMTPAANSPAAVVFNLRVSPLDAVLTVGPDIEKDVVTLTSSNGVTGTWRKIATMSDPSNDLSRAKGTTAVWTGRHALLVGGSALDGTGVGTNAFAFSPLSLTATRLELGGLEGPRTGHSAVWTGSEMIVWGGTNGTDALGTGYIYNPTTRQARATSSTNAPTPRSQHQAGWTGTKMFVHAGTGPNGTIGGRHFDPLAGANGTWTGISTTGGPSSASVYAGSFWSGRRVIMIAFDPSASESVTHLFDPQDPIGPWGRGAPPPISVGTFAFTGLKLFGYPGNRIYDVLNDTWTTAQATGAPPVNLSGAKPIVAWTGSRFIVLMRDATGSSAVYNPSGAGSWTPGPSGVLANGGVETPPHVWTGKQLLVFVGNDVWSFE